MINVKHSTVTVHLLTWLVLLTWLMPANPCLARERFDSGFVSYTFPSPEYDATVQGFQCGGPGISANWTTLPISDRNVDNRNRRGWIAYPPCVISGHNVLPLNPQFSFTEIATFNRSGWPRIPHEGWVLNTAISAISGFPQAAGYQITITRIDGRKRVPTSFRDILIRFRPYSTSLSNIIAIATPQDRSQAAKALSFDQMQVANDPEGDGWRVARATYEDFGLSASTFVRTVRVYQINSGSGDSRVDFGRFDVRQTDADNLNLCRIQMQNTGCPN